jgi:hypothetical protein
MLRGVQPPYFYMESAYHSCAPRHARTTEVARATQGALARSRARARAAGGGAEIAREVARARARATVHACHRQRYNNPRKV